MQENLNQAITNTRGQWDSLSRIARETKQQIFQPVPDTVRTVWLFLAVALIPAWMFIYSVDTANWAYGAAQLLKGESIYRPLLTNPQGQVSAHYPYTPFYAILVAIIGAPFHLLGLLGAPEIISRGGMIIAAGFWGYLGFLSVPILTSHLFESEDVRLWSGLIFLGLFPLWSRIRWSGPDIFVFALALASIYLATRKRWLLAGIVCGVAMYKFTGVPFGPALAAYALGVAGSRALYAVAAGGIISQIPNALYYLTQPADFTLLLREGSLSWGAGDVGSIITTDIVGLTSQWWYETIGFPAVFVVLCSAAAIIAYAEADLISAYAVGYISMGLLIPVGEARVIVLYLLLFLAFVRHWEMRSGRYLTALVFWLFIDGHLIAGSGGIQTNLIAEYGIWSAWSDTVPFLLIILALGSVLVTQYSDKVTNRNRPAAH